MWAPLNRSFSRINQRIRTFVNLQRLLQHAGQSLALHGAWRVDAPMNFFGLVRAHDRVILSQYGDGDVVDAPQGLPRVMQALGSSLGGIGVKVGGALVDGFFALELLLGSAWVTRALLVVVSG
jgi:hypothetical protein